MSRVSIPSTAFGRRRALAPCVAAVLAGCGWSGVALGQSAPALPPAPSLQFDEPASPSLRGGEPSFTQTRNQPSAANYGRPVRAPGYKPLPKKNARPLPALVPYAGARRGKTFALPAAPEIEPDPGYAMEPGIAQRARPLVEVDPYAPVGIDVGGLRLTPYSETSFGYDSNAARANANVKGSTFAREELGLGLQSDWSAHEVRGEMRGGYSEYFQDRNSSRPDAAGKINARVDVTRDTALEFEGRFGLDTQRPGSLELPSGAANPVEGRPWIATYGASVGAAQKYGRVTIGLRGSIDRTEYEDAKYADGTVLPLSNSNYTAYELRGRAAYELTPGITPFAELFVDTRQHDMRLDSNGYARDSQGAGGRVGTTFELTRTLTGEASVGYLDRKYEDVRLSQLRGPTFDASLVWSASPLTTVTLRGSTKANETSVVGASGALVRRGELEIGHALFRNFTLTGIALFQETDYRGVSARERLAALGLKGEYKLTREVALRASYRHEKLSSNVPGLGYSADIFMLGLRLQR